MSLVKSLLVSLEAQLDVVLQSSAKSVQSSNDDPADAICRSCISKLTIRGSSLSTIGDVQDVLRDYKFGAGGSVELEWLLLAKATIIVYGQTVSRLLNHTLPLSEDIIYWSEVLAEPKWTFLYFVQTLPLRFRELALEIYEDYQQRIQAVSFDRPNSIQSWMGTLKDSIRDRSLLRRSGWPQIVSPTAILRNQVRVKKQQLQDLRLNQAACLGRLVAHGLDLTADWKFGLVKFIQNLKEIGAVLQEPTMKADWESLSVANQASPSVIKSAEMLNYFTVVQLQAHARSATATYQACGRPGQLTRLWPVFVVGFTSGSTVLRILVSRKAELSCWIQETGATIRDFWSNWVVGPVAKIIDTIQNNETDVALISRQSLSADMQSLERMVVEFAVDNPTTVDLSTSLTPEQIERVRAVVKEGDLSPVLKAYEHDLRSPIRSAVAGQLIRALLIQIQKTKVDVEVAISGIDKLLKSQALVFGFVGITPSIAICYFIGRSIGSFLGYGKPLSQRAQPISKVIRDIERILTLTSEHGELSYQARGLLLCETHLLQHMVPRLPRSMRAEFQEDLADLQLAKLNPEQQRLTVVRMHRTYCK